MNTTKAITIFNSFYFTASIIRISPAAGFEFSVYKSIPLDILIFISLLLPLSYYLYLKDNKVYAIFTILMYTSFLLLIPVLRSYYIYGLGDPMFHLGQMEVILEDGFVQSDNHYPPIHLIGVISSLLINRVPSHTQMLLTLILPQIFFINLYVLCRVASNLIPVHSVREMGLLLPLFPILTYGHLYFGPNIISLYIFVPTIYLTYWTRHYKTHRPSLASSVLFLILPIWHPEVGLFAILIMLIYILTSYIATKGTKNFDWQIPTRYHIQYPLAIGVISFFIWATLHPTIIRSISAFFESIFITTAGSQLEGYTQSLENVPLNYQDFFIVFIVRLGNYFIIQLSGGIAGAYLVIKYARSKYDSIILLHLVFGYVLINTFSLLLLFLPFGLTWSRFLKYTMVISVVFIYISLNSIDFELKESNIVIVFLVFLLISVLLVGGMYPGPVSRTHNEQVSEMQVKGHNWTYTQSPSEVKIIGTESRYHEFLYPRERTLYHSISIPLPDRLGFDKGTTFNRTISNIPSRNSINPDNDTDTKLLVDIRDELYYQNIHPDYREHWRFYPSDFELLEYDTSVNKVYSNSEVTTYDVSEN